LLIVEYNYNFFVDWPHRDKFNNALLQLQEQGVLEKMKNKWWNEVGTGICATKEDSPDATPLAMENLAGVFLVLLVGSLCALLYGAISWVLFTIKKARHYRVSCHYLKPSTQITFKCRLSGATKGCSEGGVPVSHRL